MLEETMERLDVRPGGVYVDATLGGGGHSAEILRRAGPDCRLLGIDRDEAALERASRRLESLPGTKVFVHGNHGDLGRIADENGFDAVDGVLIDTGVSSDQLDTAERGFSFRNDGPLDMRMDPGCGETAADLVARLDAAGLADIFRRYGEEPRAGHVARAVVKARDLAPITTTGQLADIVSRSLGGPGRSRGHHPATRVFQALRMEVNDETGELERALTGALEILAPAGRLAVITFESITDRMVKTFFARHTGRLVSLQQGGERWEGELPRMSPVTRRAVTASDEEIAVNPRSRSAKLRVAEKTGRM
jgi:16S rRNA (cytosine1402-N4)-methyltransferase